MGQKVNPIGLRLGINKDWQSTWYANKQDFAKFIKEDHDIREYFKKKHAQSSVSKVEIERTENKLIVNIYTGKPGMIIGTKGAGIEQIKKDLTKIISPVKNFILNVKEIKKPDLDAQLVADSIAAQLEKRVQWRRALKQAMHIAALGKVKAHQDKAKLSFKKFLYINTNNILKNKAKFKSIIAKTSKLLVSFK